jgi:hypothetical protein
MPQWIKCPVRTRWRGIVCVAKLRFYAPVRRAWPALVYRWVGGSEGASVSGADSAVKSMVIGWTFL